MNHKRVEDMTIDEWFASMSPDERAAREARIELHDKTVKAAADKAAQARKVVRRRQVKPDPDRLHPVVQEIRGEWGKVRSRLANTGADAFRYREGYIDFVVKLVFNFPYGEYRWCCQTVRNAINQHSYTAVKMAVEKIMVQNSTRPVSIIDRYKFLGNTARDMKAELIARGEFNRKKGAGDE